MDHRNEKRNVFPEGAKSMRNALYKDRSRLPSRAERMAVYDAILATFPEAHWYARKKHQNWCSRQTAAWLAKRRRRLEFALSFASAAQPSTPPASDSSGLMRAIEYAEPRLPGSCGYNPGGPTLSTIRQWAGEAGVSVGTMAEAIHYLELMLTNLNFA